MLASFQAKRPDAQLITLEADTPALVEILKEQCSSMGLFDSKSIINGSGVCDNPEARDYILTHAQLLHESDNAFVFYEPTLSKKDIDICSKAGAVVHQHEATQTQNRNIFYLADLLLSKQIAQLWNAFHTELHTGVSAEEIAGILVFQARALHLARTHTQQASGLKPFVYRKASTSPWLANQAVHLHYQLITAYHQSRRGGIDLGTRLEQIILKLPK